MTASTSVRRRLAWMDTDAAGIWHYSTVIRLAEEAETELHRRLGIQHVTWGASPRVRVEFDFTTPVSFDEEVTTTITVAAVGRTSVTYAVELTVDERPVATGSIVTVLIDRDTGEAKELPPDLRMALGGELPASSPD